MEFAAGNSTDPGAATTTAAAAAATIAAAAVLSRVVGGIVCAGDAGRVCSGRLGEGGDDTVMTPRAASATRSCSPRGMGDVTRLPGSSWEARAAAAISS